MSVDLQGAVGRIVRAIGSPYAGGPVLVGFDDGTILRISAVINRATGDVWIEDEWVLDVEDIASLTE